MVYSSKKKILSILLSLCLIGSMFSIPMMASAATAAASPIFSVFGAAVNTTNGTVPVGSTVSTNPTVVTVIFQNGYTQVPSGALSAAPGTTLKYYDPSFNYAIAVPDNFNAAIGQVNTSGNPVDMSTPPQPFANNAANVSFVKVTSNSDSSVVSYYEFVCIRNPSTSSAITGVSDGNNIISGVSATLNGASVSFPVQSQAVNYTDSTKVPVISVTLKTGNSALPSGDIKINGASVTDGTGAALPASLGTSNTPYNIEVKSETGSITCYQLKVVALSNTVGINVLQTGVIGVSGSKVNFSGSTPAVSTDPSNPTIVNVPLSAGYYSITNINNMLIAPLDSATQVALFSDKINGTALPTSFSTTISTGNIFNIYVVTTSTDGSHGYFRVIFGVFADNQIYTLNDASASASLPIAGSTVASSPAPITVIMSSASGQFDLSKIGYTGSGIAYFQDINYATPQGNLVTAQAGKVETVYARLTGYNGASYYFAIYISRSAASNVYVTEKSTVPTQLSSVKDVNGVNIPASGLVGSNDVNNPTVVNITYNSAILLDDALFYAIQYNINSTTTTTPTYNQFTNPFITGGQSFSETATATAENGSQSYFLIRVYVAATTDSEINGIGISGSSLIGANAFPNGSSDSAYMPTVTISVPTATNVIKAANILVTNLGSAKLYTSKNFDSSTLVDATNGIGFSGNTMELYVQVLSQSGTSRYYDIVFDKTDATQQYALTGPSAFTQQGSNYVATVTVSRNLAAKLANPKLYVVYTLAGGKTQIYQTLDLASSDTSVTKDIVVGKGIASVQAFVVNGTVDWSKGTPDNMSLPITITVQ